MKGKSILALAALGLVFGLVGCGPEDTGGGEETYGFYAELRSGYDFLTPDGTDTVIVRQGVDPKGIEHSFTFASDASDIISVDETTGAVKAAHLVFTEDHPYYGATIIVTESPGGKKFELPLAVVELKSYNYSSLGYDKKAEILAKLESYAAHTHLSGIPLFEDGSYVVYQPRVELGSNNFITGYGFGLLGEGKITSPMPAATEPNPDWQWYFHGVNAEDPKNINMFDAQGTDVSDLYAYIASSFWDVKMNDAKNGYDWYPVLAKPTPAVTTEHYTIHENRPIPLDPDPATGFATKWKIPVRTGDDGLLYSTRSELYHEFDKRPVALEDYKTAIKIMLTGKFNLFRGLELTQDDSYGIAGAAKYFASTKNAFEEGWETFDSTVGVETAVEGDDSYLIYTLVRPVSAFYAMYGLANSMYEPVPQEFLKKIGGGDYEKGMANYGRFSESPASTPVDNILSLAPYTLEHWEKDKVIVFGRNEDWYQFHEEFEPDAKLRSRFSIKGIHVNILKAINEDPDAAFREWLAGKIDSAGVPTDMLPEYRTRPEARQTGGDAVFKLNMNSCTPERWAELFGENGTITQTPTSGYWDVKPWMSNSSFLDGLNYSINRPEFATKRGFVPSNNFFSSDYLIDPENGIAYNVTEEHKKAMCDYVPETFGYSLSQAKACFKTAVEELVEAGDLQLGTTADPTPISIEVWWQRPQHIKSQGEDVAKYMEDAFNDPSVCDGKVKLTVENKAVANAMDIYYEHLMVGQFDLGLGAVTGNPLDPLNFMDTLSSNLESFALNWGPDTAEVETPESNPSLREDDENGYHGLLRYDGRLWSYDNLWRAGDHGVLVDSLGRSVDNMHVYVDFSGFVLPEADDGVATFTLYIYALPVADEDVLKILYDSMALYIVFADGKYDELDFDFDAEKMTLTAKVPKEKMEAYNEHLIELFGTDYGDWLLSGDFFGAAWYLELDYSFSINGALPKDGAAEVIPV